jgi:hypothetical protein
MANSCTFESMSKAFYSVTSSPPIGQGYTRKIYYLINQGFGGGHDNTPVSARQAKEGPSSKAEMNENDKLIEASNVIEQGLKNFKRFRKFQASSFVQAAVGSGLYGGVYVQESNPVIGFINRT